MAKKVLILNDGSDYANWGIKACIDGLRAILRSAFPEAEFTSFDWNFMHKRFSYEPKIMGKAVFLDNNRLAKRLLPEFHLLPRIADEYDYIADEWEAGRGGPGAAEFIAKASQVDLVVFNAEGSTYKNNRGAMKGLFMLWYAKHRLGKKAAFLNGSVTLTLVDPVLPGIIRKVFGSIDLATVREPASYRSVLDFYPELESKVHMVPDSVFALPLKKTDNPPPLPANYNDFFVLSRSMLPMDHRRTSGQSSLGQVVSRLLAITPNVVFIAKDSEDQVLKKVAQDVGGFFVGPEYSYEDIASLLSQAAFLVSGRYHHLIMATQMGCPVIPLTTSSHKIHGLSQLFPDQMPPPFDATDLEYELPEIAKSAQSIKGAGEPLRTSYQKRAEELGQASQNQATLLRNLFTS